MVNVIAIIAFVLSMLSHWLVAHVKLRAVYVIGIVNGLCYTVLNSMLAAGNADCLGVALLIVPSVWMVITSVLGLVRLRSLDQFAESLKPERGGLTSEELRART